jgi:thiol-disulfide isomerase/thioredoxin
VRPAALTVAYLGFGLIGAAVLGAFAYERLHPTADPAEAVAPPAPVAARPAPAPEVTARVPAQRPDFTLHDLDGKAHRLVEWDGRPVIVNFWATWCAPCRRELPLLNHLQQTYAPKRLQVIGVAVDFADDVRAFLKKLPLRYPVLVGEEDGLEAARAFGVETMALPFSAFIDSSGRVLLVHLGELHQQQADAILATVFDVDAGRIAADAAPGAIRAALEALPKAPKDSHDVLQINPVQR